jgi:hypothetical protein
VQEALDGLGVPQDSPQRQRDWPDEIFQKALEVSRDVEI